MARSWDAGGPSQQYESAIPQSRDTITQATPSAPPTLFDGSGSPDVLETGDLFALYAGP